MNQASFRTRLSYTAPDIGGQLIFCVISFYLLKFYTDVYGISAAAAGTILLVARTLDAVDAPIWGVIFDRTRSRWGQSRPWFLWLCVPFALFGTLTFLTPNLGPTAKVIYAGATYAICSVLYTGINTPVTSILPALTPDPRERVVLTCFRMFGSKLGVLIVNLTALPLVAWLGGGDDRHGFARLMPLFAIGSVLLFVIAFLNLKEVVPPPPQRASIRGSFRALRGNWPWLIIFSSSLCFWIAFIARIATAPYFFEYTLHRKDLLPLANSLDFISLATVFVLPWFCRRTSKTTAWLVGLIGCVAGQLVLAFGEGTESLAWIFAGWGLGFLATGFAMALPFSILADSVDYGEWKTGVRAAGLLTAVGAAFCLKAGSGLGGALPAWVLDAFDYVPNQPQTLRALHGIELSFVWLPAVFYTLALVPVLFYGRYEKLEPQIGRDLELRRQQAAAVTNAV